jgi:hypothetical protein
VDGTGSGSCSLVGLELVVVNLRLLLHSGNSHDSVMAV